MIKKILKIEGIGRFSTYQQHSTADWDGSFGKINVIYAPNGSGKTTLSTIFKSLSTNGLDYIQQRKAFGSDRQYIKLVTDEPNPIVEYVDGVWQNHRLNIEVFDILFIEDYMYTGSILNTQNKHNLFKLIAGKTGNTLIQRYKVCKTAWNSCHEKRQWMSTDAEVLSKLQAMLDETQANLLSIVAEIENSCAPFFERYIEVSNKYLGRFAPYIKFIKFEFESLIDNSKKLRIKLIIEINGRTTTFTNPGGEGDHLKAKFTLSEGDKSAVALCFFLAHLDIMGIERRIIVFDDPLSSFDYHRKLTTINSLAKMAEGCEQFFLLTHDLYFARDFAEKANSGPVLHLKIENNGVTSMIVPHDITTDTMTTLQKDFQTVSNYLKTGVATDVQRREVTRCIRPILESVIKTKYFDLIFSKEWLGDIIAKIRNSGPASRLFKLREMIDELSELNDFSKGSHHGADQAAVIINSFELKKYVELLMTVVDKI